MSRRKKKDQLWISGLSESQETPSGPLLDDAYSLFDLSTVLERGNKSKSSPVLAPLSPTVKKDNLSVTFATSPVPEPLGRVGWVDKGSEPTGKGEAVGHEADHTPTSAPTTTAPSSNSHELSVTPASPPSIPSPAAAAIPSMSTSGGELSGGAVNADLAASYAAMYETVEETVYPSSRKYHRSPDRKRKGAGGAVRAVGKTGGGPKDETGNGKVHATVKHGRGDGDHGDDLSLDENEGDGEGDGGDDNEPETESTPDDEPQQPPMDWGAQTRATGSGSGTGTGTGTGGVGVGLGRYDEFHGAVTKNLLWAPRYQQLLRKKRFFRVAKMVSETYCIIDVFGLGAGTGRLFGASPMLLILECYAVWNSEMHIMTLDMVKVRELVRACAREELIRPGNKTNAIRHLLDMLYFRYNPNAYPNPHPNPNANPSPDPI